MEMLLSLAFPSTQNLPFQTGVGGQFGKSSNVNTFVVGVSPGTRDSTTLVTFSA